MTLAETIHAHVEKLPPDKQAEIFDFVPIKTGTYLAFYNVLNIPMAFSSKGQTNRFRKAVSQ